VAVSSGDGAEQEQAPGPAAAADAGATGGEAGAGGTPEASGQSPAAPAVGPELEPEPPAGAEQSAGAEPEGDEDGLPEAEADAGEGAGEDAAAAAPPSLADLEQESEIAADYVEGLLDAADLDGDIDMDVEGGRAQVSIVGATLGELVGRNGEVLEALQELTRLAVHRQTGNRTRIMLDVGGYRARRRTELTAVGQDAAEQVRDSGVARRLDPMTPFERKIIHDAVAAAGLRSESEGEEPNRRVVVLPAE
jgi:spoIIIJ-associated protein